MLLLIVAPTGPGCLAGGLESRRSVISGSPSAAFGWAPETGLARPGLVGDTALAGAVVVAAIVRPMARARPEMLEGEAALALGLVDESVAPGEGLGAPRRWPRKSPKRGPVAVQIVKTMINSAEGEDLDAPIEGLAGALTATTADLAEGSRVLPLKKGAAIHGTVVGWATPL